MVEYTVVKSYMYESSAKVPKYLDRHLNYVITFLQRQLNRERLNIVILWIVIFI